MWLAASWTLGDVGNRRRQKKHQEEATKEQIKPARAHKKRLWKSGFKKCGVTKTVLTDSPAAWWGGFRHGRPDEGKIMEAAGQSVAQTASRSSKFQLWTHPLVAALELRQQ